MEIKIKFINKKTKNLLYLLRKYDILYMAAKERLI